MSKNKLLPKKHRSSATLKPLIGRVTYNGVQVISSAPVKGAQVASRPSSKPASALQALIGRGGRLEITHQRRSVSAGNGLHERGEGCLREASFSIAGGVPSRSFPKIRMAQRTKENLRCCCPNAAQRCQNPFFCGLRGPPVSTARQDAISRSTHRLQFAKSPARYPSPTSRQRLCSGRSASVAAGRHSRRNFFSPGGRIPCLTSLSILWISSARTITSRVRPWPPASR